MRITSTGIIAVGTTTPNTTNKLEVSGNVGVSWAGNTFIGMKYNDGNAYKMGMQLNNVSREASFWSQSSDSDDKITFYTGSGPTERMRISTAGYVTRPYQPAFSAKNGSATLTLTDSATLVVPYDTTDYNIGGGYNTSNYRFTAPIAGIYYFYASIQFDSNVSAGNYTYFFLRWHVNGTDINLENMMPRPGGGSYASHQHSIMVQLAQGDYIDIRARQAGGTMLGLRTNMRQFYGYLMG
jgi:hypothetical protein